MTKKYDIVLLDIDNTLTELQPTLNIMAEVFEEEPVQVDEVVSFFLSEAYNVSTAHEKSFWLENEYRLSRDAVLAVDRVNKILESYTHDDTIIHVVTMRPEEMHEVTKEWLDINDISYDTLLCVDKTSKVDYVLHNDIEAVFEDNPKFFEEVYRRGLDELFDMYVVDYEYNKDVTNAVRLHRDTGIEMSVEMTVLK